MFQSLGLFGLFVGCTLSATIVPFSSEALLAGSLLLDYNVWTVVVVASLGNTVGGMVSFLLGWLCKWQWLEKVLKVDRVKLERIRLRVTRYGYPAALFAWLPFAGDLIAIAMGLMRFKPWLTALLMFVGKFLRYLVVAGVVNLF